MIFPLDWKACDFFYLPSLHLVAGTYLLECRSKEQDGGADGNYLRCAFKSLTSCCRWSMQGLCSSCVNFFGWRLERVRFSRAWPDSFLQSAWPSWMLWSSPRRPPAPPCAAVPDPPQISPVLPPVERKHKGFFFENIHMSYYGATVTPTLDFAFVEMNVVYFCTLLQYLWCNTLLVSIVGQQFNTATPHCHPWVHSQSLGLQSNHDCATTACLWKHVSLHYIQNTNLCLIRFCKLTRLRWVWTDLYL